LNFKQQLPAACLVLHHPTSQVFGFEGSYSACMMCIAMLCWKDRLGWFLGVCFAPQQDSRGLSKSVRVFCTSARRLCTLGSHTAWMHVRQCRACAYLLHSGARFDQKTATLLRLRKQRKVVHASSACSKIQAITAQGATGMNQARGGRAAAKRTSLTDTPGPGRWRTHGDKP
jgi:hypothetical protein